MLNDPRVWVPDASCRPVYFNSAANLSNGVLGTFKAPAGHTLVWRTVICSVPNGLDLNTARVVIAKTNFFPAVATDNFPCENHCGALSEVQQLGNALSHNDGFAILSSAGPRECCMILDGGIPYFALLVGVPALVVSFGLTGWVFPRS